MTLWNKIKYFNLNIFRTRLIFQTQIIWSNRIHSLKYLRSATFGSKDIVIRKSEFVAKIQFFTNQAKGLFIVHRNLSKGGLFFLGRVNSQHPLLPEKQLEIHISDQRGLSPHCAPPPVYASERVKRVCNSFYKVDIQTFMSSFWRTFELQGKFLSSWF